MVDRVEKFSKIDIHDPVASHLHLLVPQRLQGSVSTASGPEPVRDVQKVRLVHRFQHHQHRTLKNFIFIRWYSQRACLIRASLGNMHSTHGRRHVRAGFGAVEEVLEVGLQVDLVFVRGLSVHADGPVPACMSMGCEHPFHVDVMCQGRERHVRAVPGEFRDPLSFRGHVFRSRRTRHVSSPTVHKMAPPVGWSTGARTVGSGGGSTPFDVGLSPAPMITFPAAPPKIPYGGFSPVRLQVPGTAQFSVESS